MDELAFLLGTWRGRGHEEYPTVDDADYGEEIVFACAGETFVTYRQRAWAPDGGATLHAEAGFWRPAGPGRLEACLGHPLGLAEVSEGTVSGSAIRLASSAIARSATGSPVSGLERRYDVDGDVLRYDIWMALDHVALTRHLTGELRRV